MQTTAAPLSYDSIRDYAERVGQHYDIYDPSGMADVYGLLRQLGGKIEYSDETGEGLHVDQPGRFTIFLPNMTSSRRDRFTMSHEIAHYFLHYLLPASNDARRFARGGRNTAETQANVFASSLLMPAAEFTRAHQDTAGDSWSLASIFDVSPAAADVRSQVLRLRG